VVHEVLVKVVARLRAFARFDEPRNDARGETTSVAAQLVSVDKRKAAPPLIYFGGLRVRQFPNEQFGFEHGQTDKDAGTKNQTSKTAGDSVSIDQAHTKRLPRSCCRRLRLVAR